MKNVSPETLIIPKNPDYNQSLNTSAIQGISRVNGILDVILIDMQDLLTLFIHKEVETTTRMEGTHITLEDVVVNHDLKENFEERNNVLEAKGVFNALHEGKKMTKKGLPFSNRVIKKMHKALMERAMNRQGRPGEFRDLKVCVGNYFPPEPQHVSELMSNFEKYIHSNANISPMVKIAIAHAQFEIIHPFADGNGRLGRLLISFLMREYGLTNDIYFFMSSYFEKHRSEYCVLLENITKRNEWTEWINFFLSSVSEYAESISKALNQISKLYIDTNFINIGGSSSQDVKNYIFRNPYFRVPQMMKYFKEKNIVIKGEASIHRRLRDCKDIETLEISKGKSRTMYVCRKIVDIVNS